jgi:hypothetical protein
MKRAICTKGVENFTIDSSMNHTYTPKAGDVALFEVIEIGKHDSIQNASGHNCYLFPGDQFLGNFGSRYATEQFEGYVPSAPTEELEILGKGGVVGEVASMHLSFDKVGSTKIKLIGFAKDDNNNVVNTIYLNKEIKPFRDLKDHDFPIILSLGCSMDSGKTTTAAYLSRSIQKRGKKVAFIKLTGTYFTKDKHFVNDCGADYAIDFGLAGYPSTYLLDIEELLDLYQYLIDDVSRQKPDAVVIEIADGILQRETEMLLRDKRFSSQIDEVVFSGLDSLSVLYAIEMLTSLNLRPKAICGIFTMAPLLINEVKARTKIPVLTLPELENNTIFATNQMQLSSC